MPSTENNGRKRNSLERESALEQRFEIDVLRSLLQQGGILGNGSLQLSARSLHIALFGSDYGTQIVGIGRILTGQRLLGSRQIVVHHGSDGGVVTVEFGSGFAILPTAAIVENGGAETGEAPAAAAEEKASDGENQAADGKQAGKKKKAGTTGRRRGRKPKTAGETAETDAEDECRRGRLAGNSGR